MRSPYDPQLSGGYYLEYGGPCGNACLDANNAIPLSARCSLNLVGKYDQSSTFWMQIVSQCHGSVSGNFGTYWKAEKTFGAGDYVPSGSNPLSGGSNLLVLD